MMNTMSSRRIYGDLAARASLLAGRLEKKEYRPETILGMDQSGWPGDWEGRTILALVRLAETTKKEPAWLDEIVEAVLAGRNEKGYIGVILPEGEANEQQLSGHGWLLRGLVAYAAYRKDDRVLDAAKTICENLFLPLTDAYREYPCRPEERVYAGEAAGSIAKTVGKWQISTDTGCAFIPLDGLSALFEATEDPRLLELLEIMIGNFLKIDFAGICAQTHATLTAARGILRLYGVTGRTEWLEAAKGIFDLYESCGMTADYANYNWFGRPEWTEPCAVIDSFIAAMQLFRFTGCERYVTLAQRIYYNAIGFGQRENGGFGCDSCLGAEKPGTDPNILKTVIPEAYWCCTMRGGEGLASVAEYSVLAEGDAVCLPYLISSDTEVRVDSGSFRLSVRTAYPYENTAKLTITDNMAEKSCLRIYLPASAEDVKVTGADCIREGLWLNLPLTGTEQEIVLNFTLPVTAEAPANDADNRDVRALFLGNVMLSAKAGEIQLPAELLNTVQPVRACVKLGKTLLHPLFDAYETDHEPRQVLFRLV